MYDLTESTFMEMNNPFSRYKPRLSEKSWNTKCLSRNQMKTGMRLKTDVRLVAQKHGNPFFMSVQFIIQRRPHQVWNVVISIQPTASFSMEIKK